MIGYKMPLGKSMVGHKMPLGKSMIGHMMPLLVRPSAKQVEESLTRKISGGLEKSFLKK